MNLQNYSLVFKISLQVNILKDLTGRVTVTNGQRLFKFENISIPNGDFSVKYLFPDDGTHQVLLRVDGTNKLTEIASFKVFVPHQGPPSVLDPIHGRESLSYNYYNWDTIWCTYRDNCVS